MSFFPKGDSAYPLLPWLMKIIPNNENMNVFERRYNRRIRSIRSLVERVIGVLKTRFRCILGERPLRYHPTKVSKIIYACVTLHNFLIHNRFDIMHNLNDDDLNNAGAGQGLVNVEYFNNQMAGNMRREELVRFLGRQAW